MAATDFFAYEDLSVSTTAVGFTAATFAQGNYARVLVDDGIIRYRMSGTPTSSSGTLAYPGDVLEFESRSELAAFLAISRDGNTVKLRCNYGVRS